MCDRGLHCESDTPAQLHSGNMDSVETASFPYAIPGAYLSSFIIALYILLRLLTYLSYGLQNIAATPETVAAGDISSFSPGEMPDP